MTADETARRDWNIPLGRAATRLFLSSKPHEKRRREREKRIASFPTDTPACVARA